MRVPLPRLLGLWLVALLIAGQPTAAVGSPPRAGRPGTAVVLTRGPYLQLASGTSIRLLWSTSRPTTSRVDYGTDGYTSSVTDPLPVRAHNIRLDGLEPGTRYRYRVLSGGKVLREGAAFTANKPAGTPFRFAVFGDSGSGERGQYALAARMAEAAPDFVLHTGDLIYPRGAATGYDTRFFRPYRSLLERVILWPVLGNHDCMADGGAPYRAAFVLPRNGPPGVTPERCYSFEYGDAHFAAIDSNLSDGTLAREVVPWLRKDLAGTPRLWKLAFFHHPPYSAGLHGGSARIRRLLVPALKSGGVDIVFSGHDHAYERSRPLAGVTYIVTGAGGAGLYARKHPHKHTARFYNRSYSFTLVDINGPALRLRQIAANGSVVDSIGWRKRAPAAE